MIILFRELIILIILIRFRPKSFPHEYLTTNLDGFHELKEIISVC